MKEVALDELDLCEILRPGDTILWGQASAEPMALTRALVEQRRRLGQVRAFVGVGCAGGLLPEHADHIRFLSYCGSGTNRSLARAGKLDILPCHYSQLPKLIRNGQLSVDALFLQLSPPDDAGRYSLSVAHEYLLAALASARVVVAEVNACAPWTYGERYLEEDDIDVIVRTARPLPDRPSAAPDEVEMAIGRHVAQLLEDGATLQLGLGTVPEAVLRALTRHRHLGIHSGTIGDGVAELMEREVITNARKSIDRGVTVTGLAMGGTKLFHFLERNPAVRFRSTDYTHCPDVLARIDRFVALNSAIEVDLTGQVNAEVAGGLYVGAVGGAADFLRGAACSRGGLPIVALPSRAGAASRIVPRISGFVTTGRADTAIVVTEYGVADLRGLSISARIDRMLAIAHPDFRADLDRQVTLILPRTAAGRAEEVSFL